MQRSQTETIGLVLNGEALVVRFFPFSLFAPILHQRQQLINASQRVFDCKPLHLGSPSWAVLRCQITSGDGNFGGSGLQSLFVWR